MLVKDIRPILIAPAIPHEGGIRFIMLRRELQIDASNAADVWTILSLSNGYNTTEEIIKKSQMPAQYAKDLLDDLLSLRILQDSRMLYRHFHEISESPDKFFRELSASDIDEYTASPRKAVYEGVEFSFTREYNSELQNLVTNRHSCRSFSANKLSLDILGNLCACSYSIKRHSVPSGGGLYPLKLYVLVESPQEDFPAGYYEFDAERETLILFNSNVDLHSLKHCFNDECMPFGSSVQIVIAGDLERHTYKYSNRGYRLTLIEVGQVAQNISLFCTAHHLGACELGGVLDEPLRQELGLVDSDIFPLLSVAVGFPSKKTQQNVFTQLDALRNLLSTSNTDIQINNSYYFGPDVKFFGACSSYNATGIAGAVSFSSPHAMFKAMVEAYERKRSGQVRVDYHGPASQLCCKWLDPRLFCPPRAESLSYSNLQPFSEELELDWVYGWDAVSQESVMIPADMVFYGQDVSQIVCSSDSSGVAAYTDLQGACRRALLELIERDAIMRSWYTHESPNILDYSILPTYVQKRINFWKEKNRKLYILDMKSPYAPTFQAVIIGDEYPCFCSGCSASLEDWENAIIKSVHEAEFSLLLALKNNKKPQIQKEEIRTPLHHGLFYSYPNEKDTLQWLWTGKIVLSYPDVSYTYNELIHYLKPVFVDLSDSAISELKVVRAFSEKCVPIGFGYLGDYPDHPALKDLKIDINSLNFPHYFS